MLDGLSIWIKDFATDDPDVIMCAKLLFDSHKA